MFGYRDNVNNENTIAATLVVALLHLPGTKNKGDPRDRHLEIFRDATARAPTRGAPTIFLIQLNQPNPTQST